MHWVRLLREIRDLFAGLFAKVMRDGAISLLEKELVTLGIAVAIQCTPCIRLHVKKCLDAGATKEQILESASVAVMMAGGQAYTHIPIVMDTLEVLQG
jgi:AhpD family alkylhydroperoxidase